MVVTSIAACFPSSVVVILNDEQGRRGQPTSTPPDDDALTDDVMDDVRTSTGGGGYLTSHVDPTPSQEPEAGPQAMVDFGTYGRGIPTASVRYAEDRGVWQEHVVATAA